MVSDTRHLASYVESGSMYLYCNSCISNKADGVLVIKLCSWPKGLGKGSLQTVPVTHRHRKRRGGGGGGGGGQAPQ